MSTFRTTIIAILLFSLIINFSPKNVSCCILQLLLPPSPVDTKVCPTKKCSFTTECGDPYLCTCRSGKCRRVGSVDVPVIANTKFTFVKFPLDFVDSETV